MSFNDEAVPLAWDMNMLDMGIRDFIYWMPERHPMLLIVGGTGTGKSYFINLLMGKISIHLTDSTLYLCDFKDIDFRQFADCPRRWSYESCTEGLAAYYESFQARLSGADKTINRKFLIFDEWAAFVMSRDKKAMEDVKSKLSVLLMMGRGVQHHVIIGLQRADAALFPMGGRDQFGALLALGNLSREQKLMLFPDYRDLMNDTNGRGQGYLSLDGDVEGIRRVAVPSVTDYELMNGAIRDSLTR
jgi:DNA segregation ATPase FtsK/SpoIIIE-like protein